jgi:hypothetical protein
MFLPISIQSVNDPDQLPRGEYDATCLVWSSPDGEERLMEYRYTPIGQEHPKACDLLLIDASENMRLCDFLRMPDDAWRDSFGARADQLTSLRFCRVKAGEVVFEADKYALAGQ